MTSKNKHAINSNDARQRYYCTCIMGLKKLTRRCPLWLQCWLHWSSTDSRGGPCMTVYYYFVLSKGLSTEGVMAKRVVPENSDQLWSDRSLVLCARILKVGELHTVKMVPPTFSVQLWPNQKNKKITLPEHTGEALHGRHGVPVLLVEHKLDKVAAATGPPRPGS